jgi:hypothetical protein
VIVRNGYLAGSGNISITGVSATGGEVQFTSSINTLGFTGVFQVASNGILDLPPIVTDDASFGLNLSGTGRYLNASAVALTSLVINGTSLSPGIYTYTSLSNFSAFLVADTGVITVVSPTNTAPIFVAITNRTLIAGQTLNLTNVATDMDVPAQSLTFSLVNPPIGATLASNGIFTWRPTIAQSPSTNTVKVIATDNGSPSLSATNSFTVTVMQPLSPVVSGAGWSDEQFSFTVGGDAGPDYVVLASTNLVNWLPLWTNVSPVLPFGFTNSTSNFNQRFYRVLLGP